MRRTRESLLEPYYKYRDFIESLRLKEYDQNEVLHEHHIIPIHLDGDSSSDNLIKISIEDHIKAHLMLAECFDPGSYENVSNLRSARILNKNRISIEDMEKIRESYTGKNNPFYGKKHSTESLQKMKKSADHFRGKKYPEIYASNCDRERENRKKSMKDYWSNVSSEEKDARYKKITESLQGIMPTGPSNPAAFPVRVDGKRYEWLGGALKELGISEYKLYKYHKVEKLKK